LVGHLSYDLAAELEDVGSPQPLDFPQMHFTLWGAASRRVAPVANAGGSASIAASCADAAGQSASDTAKADSAADARKETIIPSTMDCTQVCMPDEYQSCRLVRPTQSFY